MKIDTKLIENFDELSAEEKLEKLLELDIDTDTAELKKMKALLDKTASEASDYKKQLRQKMSEDEVKRAEEEASRKEIEEKYNALLKENEITSTTAQFLKLGYSEELATSTAEAMFDKDINKVMANHAKFVEEKEKSIRAELMKGTKHPETGNSGSEVTKEQFDKMNYSEMLKFKNDNPELYEQFSK